MCGIVGVYNKKGKLSKELSSFFLKKSLLKMSTRGPDGHKTVEVNNYYSTGFVRLAIRDLSLNGMQPMQTDCGNFTITFNGEIYNTEYLKENLKEYNIKFSSSSDTELILYHFKYIGFKETLDLLDGIFAISFYDKKKNELYIARDRAGVKPLYVYNDDEHLIFSSNYGQVINNPFLKGREVSVDGLSAFLKLGYAPSGYGIFKNSFLMPQGSFLKLSESNYEKPILFFEYGKNNNIHKYGDLTEVIKKSVETQLISDVEVGTFLSGGIDSSIVSFVANKVNKIKAFNIGFLNSAFDESNVAKEFAKNNNIELKSKLFENINIEELLNENIKAFSEPLSDFSSLPTLMVSKFAKLNATVALSGDGGDELFYGYDRNRKYGFQYDLVSLPLIKKITKILISKITKKPLKLPVVDILNENNQMLIESNYIPGAKLLAHKIMPSITKNVRLDFITLSKNKIKNKKEYLSKLRIYDFYFHLQRVLIKVDRASMAHSLEVRVPLLSNNMIDISNEYSFADCVDENKGKLPLRKIINNIIKNPEVLSLPKKGFTLSISEIINSDGSNIIKDYLLRPIPELDKHLDTRFILDLYNNHINKKQGFKDTSWMLWSIFVLKSWFVNHIEN